MKLTLKQHWTDKRIPKLSKSLADQSRPAIAGANLVIEDVENDHGTILKRAVMYATNSYFFVRWVLPMLGTAEVEAVKPGPVPKQALQHMEKGVEFSFEEDGSIRVGLSRYDRVPAEGYHHEVKFPEYQPLVPPKPERPFTVGMNAKLMTDLAAAMGNDLLLFEFDLEQASPHGDGLTYLRAIKVKTSDSNENEAILMPVRVNV